MRTTSRFRTSPPVRVRRPMRTVTGLVLACAAVAALSGCAIEDAICSDGEYPVMTVGSTGRACTPEGEDPPKGYVRYPEGKVPEKVGDKWDIYWETHAVDEKGEIITVPAAG
ncbi:SCO0607 family lipoprotein [Streptomyces sp. NPDC059255]|uniref:SCO0607 family lipoprotein n=1 Tax=Streptomyces sp. NPDC059255 TaxID=3346793 RepID=UPI003679B7B0